jgi:carbamoyltransferase
MKVMGFHSWHDCAFCVLDNGYPVIHAELERYTREKEPSGDAVKLFYEKYAEAEEVVHFATCLDSKQGGVKTRHPDSYQKMENQAANAPSKLEGGIHVIGHHLAHAAHAFYSSNFEDAVILTIDGGGPEFLGDHLGTATSAVYLGSGKKIKQDSIAPHEILDIGGFWTEFTKHVFGLSTGYPKGHQAGTVMAMACMGDGAKYGPHFDSFSMVPSRFTQKKWTDFWREAIKNTSPGDWWGTVPPEKLDITRIALDASLDIEKFRKIASSSEQEKFNVAAGVQFATENAVIGLLNQCKTVANGCKNLCLSGGVALNSVLVGKIKHWFKDDFENIYVPPVPYDAGLAIGAAQYVWHHVLENDRIKWENNFTPYLGELYSREDVEKAIAASPEISHFNVSDNEVLDLLADEKIVSVFGGKSESGRRALGNRSILADPRSPDMKSMINQKVKHRQWFRPFAPSILREEVSNWFEEDIDSPYMSFVIKFKEEVVDKVPAVVHFDNTARLQTVTAADNEWYYNFLISWQHKTGVPILLNTSFNDREPIVETPEHAIGCFLRTEIDYLYFFDYGILCKKT